MQNNESLQKKREISLNVEQAKGVCAGVAYLANHQHHGRRRRRLRENSIFVMLISLVYAIFY